MISAIYASLCALIIFWLSLNVIKVRRSQRVSVGDGGKEELKVAIGAQFNAVEYIPITLLLLFALELNHANHYFIHLFGLLLIVGRVIHAWALLKGNLSKRVLGMQITLYNLLILAVANIIYMPFDKLF